MQYSAFILIIDKIARRRANRDGHLQKASVSTLFPRWQRERESDRSAAVNPITRWFICISKRCQKSTKLWWSVCYWMMVMIFNTSRRFIMKKRRGPAVFGLMCRWQMFYTIFFQHTICPIFVANWTTSSADMALKFRLGISDKNMRIGVGWR